MKKNISNNLRIATMAIGIALANSAGAIEISHPEKISKTNDLLCVAIEGQAPLKSALTVLQVDNNGQAQGALCYVGSLLDTELGDCHLVDGRVLKAPSAVSASYVGLIGTGIDNDELVQNDVAIKFETGADIGKGSAAEFVVAAPEHDVVNYTGLTKAFQAACTLETPSAQLTRPAPSSSVPTTLVVNFPMNSSIGGSRFTLNLAQKTRLGNCINAVEHYIPPNKTNNYKLKAECIFYALTGI